MAKVKIAVIVGSNRRDSMNRKLAQALARLAPDRLTFNFVSIGDLPLYSQDLEGELPQSVVRFKAEIAAADALLFVTPEHNQPGLVDTSGIITDENTRGFLKAFIDQFASLAARWSFAQEAAA
jgi:NADPH-dependent FMN reductase